MTSKIRRCGVCGEYTLQPICPKCGSSGTKRAKPQRFSPQDHYGKYRRMMKYGRDRAT